MERQVRLRIGDWVEVKSPSEIGATLDANGTLDGLPFMPEMIKFSGRQFRLLRRAEKTCVEVAVGRYAIREFRKNDVVILDGLRCTGDDHDGCERACTLFWKEVWLRKVEPGQPASCQGGMPCQGPSYLILETHSAPRRYVCQSTELIKATQLLPRHRKLLKCLVDVCSGNRGMFEMTRLILWPLWLKAAKWFPRRKLSGTLKRTPVGDLNLRPGEWVEVRSEFEIAKTLDARGRNRGLICDLGMTQYAGNKYRVRSRLDRMISEPTGEMRQVEGTVVLDGLHCLCWDTLGGCPRAEFMYWREVWLDRIHCDSGSLGQVNESKSMERWTSHECHEA